MDGPDSLYSFLVIHICWKVVRDAKIDPPIQTEYLRSGGAMTLTFIEDGATEDTCPRIRNATAKEIEKMVVLNFCGSVFAGGELGRGKKKRQGRV